MYYVLIIHEIHTIIQLYKSKQNEKKVKTSVRKKVSSISSLRSMSRNRMNFLIEMCRRMSRISVGGCVRLSLHLLTSSGSVACAEQRENHGQHKSDGCHGNECGLGSTAFSVVAARVAFASAVTATVIVAGHLATEYCVSVTVVFFAITMRDACKK